MFARSALSSIRRIVGPAWPDEARYILQAPLFSRLLTPSPFHGTVLNAGCGEGLFSEFIEAFPSVRRIVNVDVSSRDIARGRFDDRNEFVQSSLTSLPFPDATFDSVLCTEVLEHVDDDAGAARELARVTRPGGVLLVSVPTPPAPPDDLHVRQGYTLDELRALLDDAGFTIERHDYCFFDFMRALMPVWRWQFRVLGRSRRNFAPRAFVRGLARLDASIRPGKPWDLAAVARRRT